MTTKKKQQKNKTKVINLYVCENWQTLEIDKKITKVIEEEEKKRKKETKK